MTTVLTAAGEVPLNPRAVIGGNNPPVDPFDAISTHIDDLFDEAKNHLDGEPIANQGQADAIQKLADDAHDAWKAAEDARKIEKKPHDDAAKAVQAKWTPLTSKAELAKQTALRALTPWKVEQQRIKDEAAAKARAEAEAIAQAAREAAQAAAAANDLSAREEAETLLKAADKASKTANRIERAPTGLRTVWRAEITDRRAALNHYLKAAPDEFVEVIQRLASADVRAGLRNIPGVEAIEEKKAA